MNSIRCLHVAQWHKYDMTMIISNTVIVYGAHCSTGVQDKFVISRYNEVMENMERRRIIDFFDCSIENINTALFKKIISEDEKNVMNHIFV